MTPDPITQYVGGGLLVALCTVVGLLLRLLFNRQTHLDKASDAMVERLEGQLSDLQTRCAEETAELRGQITAARREHGRTRQELTRTREVLAATRLQLAELQHWEGKPYEG